MIINNIFLFFKEKIGLTALVRTVLWRAIKNNGSTWRQITDAHEEQKRSRYKQSTLRMKDFKYGPLLSIFVLKLIVR